MKVLWYLVSWCKTYKLSDKWWENMLISTTHFRFRVPCENFELFKFLTDVRMVSIIQLRFFQSLLQLVHTMNFKRRTCTLEVEDSKKKKSFRHLVGKKRTEALLVLEKFNTERIVWLKNAWWRSVYFIKSRILTWSEFWFDLIWI